MHIFVTFCIGIGVALLVLAVISNTSYAATTTETADGNPTIIGALNGSITGDYANTTLDNGKTQNWTETDRNPCKFDGYYTLNTSINESRISEFEIGINAWMTKTTRPDNADVYVYNYTAGDWDQTSITVSAESETHYNDTVTMGIAHVNDSDGQIRIRLVDTNRASNDNREDTLHIDYLYVKLTYTTISGVTTDKLTYKNGETITTTWTPAADCCGSGESYINVEYWDVTAGTQFNLTSHATSAISSTSKALTSSEVGHKINVYVYTTSSSSGDRSTAITQGGPWPDSISNAVGPTSWNSYNDSAHNYQDDTFSGDEHYVYMHGTGFNASHAYHIAYYDADGYKALSDGKSSGSDKNLSSHYYFPSNTSSAEGTWHAVVYDDDIFSPPSTYVSSDPNSVVEDDFYVYESAIPEFPAVIAAIAVCMLCAVAYVVMRRKAEKG